VDVGAGGDTVAGPAGSAEMIPSEGVSRTGGVGGWVGVEIAVGGT